jgi:hypothetical protein
MREEEKFSQYEPYYQRGHQPRPPACGEGWQHTEPKWSSGDKKAQVTE